MFMYILIICSRMNELINKLTFLLSVKSKKCAKPMQGLDHCKPSMVLGITFFSEAALHGSHHKWVTKEKKNKSYG